MASRAETQTSVFDTVKLVLAVSMVAVGIGLFHYYADQSTLYRVLALLAIVGVATAIAMTTAKGRELWAFRREASNEVSKMVWPSRAETIQTTVLVFAVVIFIGVFMWLLDLLLGWLMTFVIR